MLLTIKLALKNLLGAGLRTWLNVIVLSFAFVTIILYNGILEGWHQQSKRDTIEWEIGNGQLKHKAYDVYDPFSIKDGHGDISSIDTEQLLPILFHQGNIYPEGRMMPITIRGIKTGQNILKIPTESLATSSERIPIIIGQKMANNAKLKVGDKVMLRWRDKGGTFDATKATVVDVFETNVPTIDNGQIWMSIDKLWEITGLNNQATLLVAAPGFVPNETAAFEYQNHEVLLKELNDMIASKKASSVILYGMLMVIALIAIFDTQVLSVFRRQQEIGTYVALGMTRKQVVGLFTLEGGLNSVLAVALGTLYGLPLMMYLSAVGMGMPSNSDEYGVAIADRIYPAYTLDLWLSTIIIIVICATIVSFIPARKIARMNPVEALKGKIQWLGFC